MKELKNGKMKFESFVEYLLLEKKYSVNTVKAYENDLKEFSEFIEENYQLKKTAEVEYNLIRAWIVVLLEKKLSNRSVNRKISSLQAYYNFLLKTQQIEKNPLVKHKSLKVSEKVQVPFSQKEMKAVMENSFAEDFEGIRDRLIIELLYSTGMRRGELIAIKTVDVDVNNKELKVRGKGNKERLVPILSSVVKTLKLYLEEREKLEEIKEDYLFLTKKGKQLYPGLVYRVVKLYFRGVSTKTKISPHVLRHTFATHLLNEGADLNSIKSLLGHESLASTQIYAHNDIAILKKVHAKAHPRNKKSKK